MAGEGIDTAGDLFAKATLRSGWHVWTTRHFPSRIRGGLTSYTTRIAGGPVAAATGGCDLLVALHQQAADPGKEGLSPGGVVLYDSGKVKPPKETGDHRWIGVDCTGIAKELGEQRARNTVALGASARLLGVDRDVLAQVIRERFDKKAKEVKLRARLTQKSSNGDEAAHVDEGGEEPALVTVNREALIQGWEAVEQQEPLPAPEPVLGHDSGRLFVSGNEAFAFGALVAGCRFYAGYPITPATTIMEYLAERLPSFGGVCLQVEDELAAVSMAIGAGYSGVRAMTASSGPGVSLMAEAMGLAGSTETPVVIVDCQRPGPSTGMPTKTAQEDISFLLSAGHGETPHIVLTAEDLEAAYLAGLDAFDLAERYQCPVFVALDAAMSIGKGDTAAFPLEVGVERGHRFTKGLKTPGAGEVSTGKGYARSDSLDGGLPLRAVPGDKGGRHYANSTEHGPAGYTTEVPEVRTAMVDRRNRKLAGIDTVHAGTRVEGDPEGPLGVIAFGSMVPVVREALAMAGAQGSPGALLVLRRLWPLPRDEVAEFMEKSERVVVVEGNSTGQLLRHLKSEVADAHHAESVLHYSGEPMTVAELLPRLLEQEEDV